MVAAIDTGLDFFRQVLALRAYRQEILAADIANASTPGFKGIDLDFASALSAATGGRSNAGAPVPPKRLWLVDDPRQMADTAGGANDAARPFVKYQADTEVTLDGNSVDLDQEKVTAGQNAVQYEAAATFASQMVRLMMVAITGSASQQSNGS